MYFNISVIPSQLSDSTGGSRKTVYLLSIRFLFFSLVVQAHHMDWISDERTELQLRRRLVKLDLNQCCEQSWQLAGFTDPPHVNASRRHDPLSSLSLCTLPVQCTRKRLHSFRNVLIAKKTRLATKLIAACLPKSAQACILYSTASNADEPLSLFTAFLCSPLPRALQLFCCPIAAYNPKFLSRASKAQLCQKLLRKSIERCF